MRGWAFHFRPAAFSISALNLLGQRLGRVDAVFAAHIAMRHQRGSHPARTRRPALRAAFSRAASSARALPRSPTGRSRCSFRPIPDRSTRPRYAPALRPAAAHWHDRSARRFRSFFERDQSSRSQHAHLPHAAAQCFAENPRPRNQFRRTHQHRSHRRAQPFRQAEHHRIEAARQRLYVDAQRHSRIEDARAVEVQWKLVRLRSSPNLFQNFHTRADARRQDSPCSQFRSAPSLRGTRRTG